MVLIVLLALMFVGGLIAGCGASSGTPSAKIVHGLGPSGHEDADGDHDFHSLTGDYGSVALAQVAGEFGNTRYLRGGSCAAVLSRLFGRAHAELAVDRHTLEVLPVRVKGNVAVALLAWARLSREGQIVLLRQHGTWRLDGLIDGPRPIDGEAR